MSTSTTSGEETPGIPGGRRYAVLPFLRPYRARLGGVFLVIALGTFLGLLNPWFVQQLIDRILSRGREDLLWVFALVIAGVALVRFGMSVFQAWLYAGLTARVLLDMRTDFLRHLQTLSLRFFGGTRFGEIVTRFNRDLSVLQETATGALLAFLSNAFTLLGTLAWALYYDWRLFLLAALPFPLAAGVAGLFRGRVRRLTAHLRELSGELASIVVETITGIRTVRSFGREKGELRKFVGKGHELVRGILSFQVTNALAGGLPRVFVVAASVIVYVAGGRAVIRGEKQLGELVALGMYVAMVYAPLVALVETWLQLVQARVSLERVREVRELDPEVREDPAAPLPAPLRGAIEFDDVHFRHEPDRPLLEGVSFRIEPGETVALVGPSGAGKSTVVDLLFRFLDPQRGAVRIDGQDLRAVRTRRLRAGMAVIAQDVFLFHASLLENVRFGRPGAARAEVEGACAIAGMEPMLAALPGGLDTIVGERGAKLSGGERQRVAIARALLRAPRILVLDEATAALDYRSDRAIRAAIERLMGDATTLVVTHRLETLGPVDRVLALDGGRIEVRARPASGE